MRRDQIRNLYPDAWRLIQRMIDTKEINQSAVDGLSHEALERIDNGRTPERDARLLLIARHTARQRELNKQKRRAA